MAQPATLLPFPIARRADARAIRDVGFTLDSASLAGTEKWRPAKSLTFVVAICGAFWLAAALAYLTLH